MAKVHPELAPVLRQFDEAGKYHNGFVDGVERRYKAWRGILSTQSEAAQWTSKLHPPYIMPIVETIVANFIDDRFRFQINPRPRVGTPEELESLRAGAKAMEYLLRYQLDVTHFQEQQRPFLLQNVIAGLTAMKVYWRSDYGPRMRLTEEQVEVEGPLGPMFLPSLKEESYDDTLYDDPCVETIDVRDFFWEEAAVSLEKAGWVAHRCWYSYDELKEMEKAGVYSSVDELKESRDFSQQINSREGELFNVDRTRGRVEVIEFWRRRDKKVITIANRKVVLSSKPWPFWHGDMPFVVCSSSPDLFRIPGVSVVERLEQLQEALWTLMNQRIDNLQLVNNAIIMLRSDVDDPDAFEFGPGEKWLVEDPTQVQMWTPDPTSAQISLPAEANIRGDMQNVSNGGPFLSGAQDQTVDQDTATGVSIITSLAQKVMAGAKQNVTNAYVRVGEQMIGLNQQFIRRPRLVRILGEDGADKWIEVNPLDLQGQYLFETQPATESMMRQERRAEAQALVQVAGQLAPIMAAVGQPLNMQAFVDKLLDAFDIQDKERFYSLQPQMPMGGAPGSAPSPQNGAPGPGGVTAPQSIAPETSPSNASSMSPEVMMQRFLASGAGGASNV